MAYKTIFCKKIGKDVTVTFEDIDVTTLNDSSKKIRPGLLCNCSETGPYNLCAECTALAELNKDK